MAQSRKRKGRGPGTRRTPEQQVAARMKRGAVDWEAIQSARGVGNRAAFNDRPAPPAQRASAPRYAPARPRVATDLGMPGFPPRQHMLSKPAPLLDIGHGDPNFRLLSTRGRYAMGGLIAGGGAIAISRRRNKVKKFDVSKAGRLKLARELTTDKINSARAGYDAGRKGWSRNSSKFEYLRGGPHNAYSMGAAVGRHPKKIAAGGTLVVTGAAAHKFRKAADLPFKNVRRVPALVPTGRNVGHALALEHVHNSGASSRGHGLRRFTGKTNNPRSAVEVFRRGGVRKADIIPTRVRSVQPRTPEGKYVSHENALQVFTPIGRKKGARRRTGSSLQHFTRGTKVKKDLFGGGDETSLALTGTFGGGAFAQNQGRRGKRF